MTVPSTPKFALPYPGLGDTPDVPYYMQQLAESLEAALDPVLDPPAAILTRGTNTSVASGSYQKVPLDLAAENVGGMGVVYDAGSPATTSRITAARAGLYHVEATVAFGGSSSVGGRYTAVYKNGASIKLATGKANDALVSAPSLSFDVRLTVGQYLELYAYQNSGSGILLNTSPLESTFLSARWVRA